MLFGFYNLGQLVYHYLNLCRPFGACIVDDALLRRVSPYANLCRPVGACIRFRIAYIGASPYANLYRPFPTSRDKSRLFFNKYKVNLHIITYIISPA